MRRRCDGPQTSEHDISTLAPLIDAWIPGDIHFITHRAYLTSCIPKSKQRS